MDHSKFDQFIRSNSHEELSTPPGLDWEEMNIPIPPPEKKKRRFFFLWLLLAGTGFALFGLWALSGDKISSDITTQTNKALNDSKTISSNTLTSEIPSEVIPANHSVSSSATIAQKIIVPAKPEITEQKTENNTVSSSLESRQKKHIVLTDAAPSDKRSSNILEPSPRIPAITIPLLAAPGYYLENLSGNDNSNVEESDSITFLSEEDLTKNANFWSLSVSYGLNSSQNVYSNTVQKEALENADDLALGSTYHLQLEQHFRKHVFWYTGLSFQRLHSTFYYEKFLGFEDNFADLIRTSRTRKVYHNNYLHLLELNLGLGKSFFPKNKIGLDLSIQLNPTLSFNPRGRTLDEELNIINIEDQNSGVQWMFSAGTRLDLRYNFKTSSISLGLGYTQVLSKLQIISDSDLTNQPRVLELRIGLRKRL